MKVWQEHLTKVYPYGQPPVTIEEVFKVGDIVKRDAGWRHAMKRRGLDDADIELVQVDPFSAGYFDREVEKGRRLVSAVSFWRRDIKDNGYAHPIEGVVALVDLIEDRVVSSSTRPILSRSEAVAQLRPRVDPENGRDDVKPMDIVQKDGPGSRSKAGRFPGRSWSFRVRLDRA